ncbi:MAG TPA: carboxypeptidase regulatory-like domain-containing protein, partial [Gemmatimonadaceae bacterium]
MIRSLSRWLLVLALPIHAIGASVPNERSIRPANVDLTGVVTDSTNGQPLQSAEISVANAGGGVVSNTVADAFGRFTIHNLAPGSYTIGVHLLGFRPLTRPLTVDAAATAGIQLRFAMAPVGLNLDAVQVTATAPVSVDTRTGDQVFKQNDYHGAPTTTTSQILQQSIVGAARAPTGEVHIRGQHAEYTYYIDGVPVPPGISGSFNELFDPQVVNQISFQTGGWDAEYGNRVAAVVNVTTKIPTGGFHGNVSSYVGEFQGANIAGA